MSLLSFGTKKEKRDLRNGGGANQKNGRSRYAVRPFFAPNEMLTNAEKECYNKLARLL